MAALAAGCKSAATHRADADREAYELVQSRREKLGLETLSFTIEPAADSLEARLRSGEVDRIGPVDLVACLEIAAENSRDYRRRKEALYLAALDLTLERWRFAVQKGGTIGAALDGTGDEAQSADGGGRFSLTRLLGTGARIVGDIGLGLTRSLISSDGWHATSDIGLSITQPLLAGAGEAIVKEPLTQAERNLVYEVRAFERFRRTFAFDVASRYYRLLQARDQVRNQESDVENLRALTQRNLALAEAGRLSDIEVGQARQNELRSANDLLSAQERFERQLDDFKLFLGVPVPVPAELDASGLSTLADAAPPDAEVDEATAMRTALSSRLDYITVLEQEEDAVRRVAVAEDALAGALGLRAEARATSADGQPLKYDFRDATWGVGLDFTLPFERLPQRNAWREALIARAAAERASRQAEDQIRADLRESLRLAAARLESWRIQQSAVALAERRIESTRLKLDAGRADTRDLLEAQDSLLGAQNALTAALIEYTLARMSLYLDMELLRFDAGGIRLEPPGPAGLEAQP